MKTIPFLFLLFTCFSNAFSQEKVDHHLLIKNVRELINKYVTNHDIPGAVIQIKKGKKVLLKKAFGYAAAYGMDGKPLAKPEKMTTRHLFDIASLTKVIGTTTAIMYLVDKAKIKIDDPISNYLLVYKSDVKGTITIRQLLSHTAGLYDWYPMYYRASNRKEVYDLIASLPLKYPIGKERHYSDLGFTVLGQIIEEVSQMSLEDFFHTYIFSSLHMRYTVYNPTLKKNINGKPMYPKIATTSPGNPYEYRMVHDTSLHFSFSEIDPDAWAGWRNYMLKGEVNDGNAWYAGKGVSGAAGLFSTVENLQILTDMLIHKGKVHGKVFISEKTIQSFLTQDEFKNGLGWMMDPDNAVIKNAPPGSFGHTGFTGTSIAVIPSSQISIILLVNRQNQGLKFNNAYFNLSELRQEIFKMVSEAWR